MGTKLELTEKHIKYLEKLPEQGMGYQIVDILLKNGNTLKDRLVFNCTYLEIKENDSFSANDIESMVIKT